MTPILQTKKLMPEGEVTAHPRPCIGEDPSSGLREPPAGAAETYASVSM